MSGIWYPYTGLTEAQSCVGCFADASVGAHCGISFSDGQSISIIRPAQTDRALWLNVLARHVAAPPPPSQPPPRKWYSSIQGFFEQAIQYKLQNDMLTAQAQAALVSKVIGTVQTNIWEPTHNFLLHHKLVADGLGVIVDAVGVVAGIAFAVAAAPELVGGAAIIGTAGLITGGMASVGSLMLFVADGRVFGAELAGNAKLAAQIEDARSTQWIRVVGTILVLPDIPIGGIRALKEIGVLSREAEDAQALSRTLSANAEAQRLRIQKIHNPERHPRPIQYHASRARKLAREATEQSNEAERAHARIRLLALRDVNASFVATPVGAGLFAAAPPGMLLTGEQRENDERAIATLAPRNGMPKDVRLEMRVTSVTRGGGQ